MAVYGLALYVALHMAAKMLSVFVPQDWIQKYSRFFPPLQEL